MRRTLIGLTLAIGLLAVAGPASAATPTRKSEDRMPGGTFVHLQHGKEDAIAILTLNGDICDDDSDGLSKVWAEANVLSPGHRVSAESIALIRGASIVRRFDRQQVATSEVSTRSHYVVPTAEAIYRVKATIAVRWKDHLLSRYTIYTKYSDSVPPCGV